MRTWRLLTLAAVLTAVMTGTVISADTVKIFRYDGSLQCGMGQVVSLEEMARELAAANIKVLSSEKRVVSIFREYRPAHKESRAFSLGCMVAPQLKSRSMTEACNVKWVDPCH